MSDPGAPAYSLPTQWATTTLYPAGSDPWSSQPTKVAPLATLITPAETPAAEEWNDILNERDGVDISVKSYLTDLHTWVSGKVTPLLYAFHSFNQGGGAVVTSLPPWTGTWFTTENMNMDILPPANVLAGDVLEIEAEMSVSPTVDQELHLRLGVSLDSTTGFDGTYTECDNSEIADWAVAGQEKRIRVRGLYTVPTLPVGSHGVFLAIQANVATGQVNKTAGNHWRWNWKLYRPVP